MFCIVEKSESLLCTAEDKETSEQDSKKLSEQEVSPFNSISSLSWRSSLLSCPSACGHLFFLSCLSTLYQISFSSSRFPRQTSSAEAASVSEKAADSEESKASSEEKTGDERDRTESPSKKTEPSVNPKETALRQTELSSSQTSPRGELVNDSC